MSIDQEEVERGLRYMREHAPDLAKAKANHIYINHYLKSCHAMLYSKAPGKTVEDKKNWAYAHPDYLEQLNALKIAVEEEELHNFKMKAAEALAEVWRTESANNRMTDRSHQ